MDSNLTLYLDELSRVFFKKENLRNKTDWYISTFYSFCIQSFVRKALQQLSRDHEANNLLRPQFASFVNSALAASKEYLHLAVHLFIASCGTCDPLLQDQSIGYGYDVEALGDYEADLVSLRQAVGVPVKSSSEYLKKIFEIEEAGTPSSATVGDFSNPFNFNSQGPQGSNSITRLRDPYDPMFDMDPFGLSASMQFPTHWTFYQPEYTTSSSVRAFAK